jgi:iron(III) transport system permease protein
MAVPFLSFSVTSRRPGLVSVINTIVLALFLIIVIGPLAGLAVDLARLVLSGTAPAAFASLFSDRRIWLLVQSLLLAAAVAAAGIGTGILVATALWRKPAGITFAVLLMVLALAPVPPYIHALTWSQAIATLNRGLTALGSAPLPATGWTVSFWVEFMAMLPVAIFLSYIALASVDRTLVEAARMVRPDADVLHAIILPLAAPTLSAAFGFLVVLSCTDYSVPSLFGSDTYALDIFSTYSASGSAAGALVAAIPLLIVTLSVMTWCRLGIRRLAQTPNWTAGSWDTPPEFPALIRMAQEGALALLGIQVVVIFMGLVLAAGSLQRIATTVQFSAREIQNSFLVVACTILIALPLALAVSRELLREDRYGSLWWGIILVPLAVPAPLVGIGLISLWNNPAFSPVYGTFLMPVFASVCRFTPFAAVILFVQIRSVDPALFDAARVFSRDTLHTSCRIFLPLLAPGLFVASAVLGALTLGELGATLIVTPPGFGTLAIKIYNYLHYGAAPEVAGLCLVMVTATLLAGLCIVTALLRQRRTPGTIAQISQESIP